MKLQEMLVYANVCKCMQKLLSPTASPSPLRCGRLTFLTWSFRRWWDEFQIRGSQSEAGHFDNPMEVTVYPPRTKVHDFAKCGDSMASLKVAFIPHRAATPCRQGLSPSQTAWCPLLSSRGPGDTGTLYLARRRVCLRPGAVAWAACGSQNASAA